MRHAAITIVVFLLTVTSVRASDALHNSGDWSREKAAHLLRRAGLGGTPGQIDFLAGLGREKAVAYLVGFERVKEAPIPIELRRYRGMIRKLRRLGRDERQKKRMAHPQSCRLIEQITFECDSGL